MVFEPGAKTWWISPGVMVSGLDVGLIWNQETRKRDDLNYSLMIDIRKTLTLHVDCAEEMLQQMPYRPRLL